MVNVTIKVYNQDYLEKYLDQFTEKTKPVLKKAREYLYYTKPSEIKRKRKLRKKKTSQNTTHHHNQ